MTTGSPLPDRRIVITRLKHRGQYFTEMLDDTTPLDMMLIPGGTFLMGQTEDEKIELIRQVGEEDYQKYYVRELPRHAVTVPLFFMGKYPITQAQWRAVAAYPDVEQDLDSDPSYFKGDKRPVEQVSWDDATEFCRRLSHRTGRTYRLPSEAEWEYACRASPIQTSGTPRSGEVRSAGTETPFHFGETLSDDLANYAATGVFGRGISGQYRLETTDVGSFPANPFGLYDMHGNVLEWCADDWHDNYEAAPVDGSAWLKSDRAPIRRVLRGGALNDQPRHCRAASRRYFTHDRSVNYIGFWVCCIPPIEMLGTLA